MKKIAMSLAFSAAALTLAGCQKSETTETAAPTEEAAATDAATDAAADAATEAAPASEGLDDTNNPIGPGKG